MMWPGCKAEIHGVRPTWWMAYNQTYPNKSRIDDVIKWFSSEDKPINLGLLYFSEPDHSGHEIWSRIQDNSRSHRSAGRSSWIPVVGT